MPKCPPPSIRLSAGWFFRAFADLISCWKQIPGTPTSSKSIPGQLRSDISRSERDAISRPRYTVRSQANRSGPLRRSRKTVPSRSFLTSGREIRRANSSAADITMFPGTRQNYSAPASRGAESRVTGIRAASGKATCPGHRHPGRPQPRTRPRPASPRDERPGALQKGCTFVYGHLCMHRLGCKAGTRCQTLQVHQSLRLFHRRRNENRRFRGDSEESEGREALQDLEPYLHL